MEGMQRDGCGLQETTLSTIAMLAGGLNGHPL